MNLHQQVEEREDLENNIDSHNKSDIRNGNVDNKADFDATYHTGDGENLDTYDEFQVQNDDDPDEQGYLDKGDSYTEIVSRFEVVCLPNVYKFWIKPINSLVCK